MPDNKVETSSWGSRLRILFTHDASYDGGHPDHMMEGKIDDTGHSWDSQDFDYAESGGQTIKTKAMVKRVRKRDSIPKIVFMTLHHMTWSPFARIVGAIMLIATLLSVVSLVFGTMHAFRHEPDHCERPICEPGPDTYCHRSICYPEPVHWLHDMEIITMGIFTIDYVLRMLTVHAVPRKLIHPEEYLHGRLKGPEPNGLVKTIQYGLDWMNLVDLAAIVPFYVDISVTEVSSLTFFHLLRLLQVIRVFKFGRFADGHHLVLRTLKASTPALFLMIFFLLCVTVLFGTIMYYCEAGRFKVTADAPEGAFYRYSGHGLEQEISPFVSIPMSSYWVIMTATTVGFSEFHPVTHLGRSMAVVVAYSGIVGIALPAAILGKYFNDIYFGIEDPVNEEKEFLEREKTGDADEQTQEEKATADAENLAKRLSSKTLATHIVTSPNASVGRRHSDRSVAPVPDMVDEDIDEEREKKHRDVGTVVSGMELYDELRQAAATTAGREKKPSAPRLTGDATDVSVSSTTATSSSRKKQIKESIREYLERIERSQVAIMAKLSELHLLDD